MAYNTAGGIVLKAKFKKIYIIPVVVIIVLCLGFWFLSEYYKNVSDVKLNINESSVYSEDDILDAVSAIKKDFRKNFGSRSKLLKLSYDDTYNEFTSDGVDKKYKQIIVIKSEFYYDSKDEGGLESSKTYTNYNWTLARESDNDKWVVQDRGFC